MYSLYYLFCMILLTVVTCKNEIETNHSVDNLNMEKAMLEDFDSTLFFSIRRTHPDIVNDEQTLYDLGYQYLQAEKLDTALTIFKLQSVLYPQSTAGFDALGEVYMLQGNIKEAIVHYSKALSLEPRNQNAERFLCVLNNYSKTEHFIQMRDGISLYTQVYTPKDTSTSYPIILERTPYSLGYYGNRYRNVLGPNPMYAQEQFIFVYQEVRGRLMSGGEFDLMRPLCDVSDSSCTDESTDTYDTIEWLIGNIPNHNGRVAQWGTSYTGWQSVMGAINPHPNLVASLPQGPPVDMWMGDDFHHNGAFRYMYTFNWILHHNSGAIGEAFDFGTNNGYQFFMDLGPPRRVNETIFSGEVRTWNKIIEHSDYDHYWVQRNALNQVHKITIPMVLIAGWFDAEDFYGPIEMYKRIESTNKENETRLVIGPWKHSGWNWMRGDRLGNIEFSEPTGDYFRHNIELPFFKHYLKNEESLDLPEVLAFETGNNEWRRLSNWPPNNTSPECIYLQAEGQVTWHTRYDSRKTRQLDFTEFVSDPDNPVPWSTEVRTSQGHLWMVEDQRFVSGRPDVIGFKSETLDREILIAGPVEVDLFVSITGSDADWVVKLIDELPPDSQDTGKETSTTGFQMLLTAEVFRSKYHSDWTHPKAINPKEVYHLNFQLPDRLHRFRKGHKLVVQIQSSWFPVIDMNPQQYVDIYTAKPEDYKVSRHRVYHSKEYPSRLTLNTLEVNND